MFSPSLLYSQGDQNQKGMLWNIGIGPSYIDSSIPWSDVYKRGVNYELSGIFGLRQIDNADFEFGVNYSRHSIDSNKFPGLEGGDLGATILKFGILYYLDEPRPEKALFFLHGGWGRYLLNIADINIGDSTASIEEQNGNVVYAGVGFFYPTENFMFYFKPRYEIMFIEGENLRYYPLTMGLVF